MTKTKWCSKCGQEADSFCKAEHVWGILGIPEGTLARFKDLLHEEKQALSPKDWDKAVKSMTLLLKREGQPK